jgi:hypothetical protein
MGFAQFDRSRWPVVVVALNGKPADPDVEQYLAELDQLLREDERGVLVVDTSRAELPTPEQRRRIGEWMRAHKAALAARGLGCVFVLPSGLFRFVLSSIFLIQRPPMPYAVVATLDEALAWARAQIRTVGARGRI